MQGVEDLLAVAAVAHHVVHAQQSQMMADGWLRKSQLFAEGGHVSFALREAHENAQACFVGQYSEQRRELIKILFTNPLIPLHHRSTPKLLVGCLAWFQLYECFPTMVKVDSDFAPPLRQHV